MQQGAGRVARRGAGRRRCSRRCYGCGRVCAPPALARCVRESWPNLSSDNGAICRRRRRGRRRRQSFRLARQAPRLTQA
jgi:hypothetical protein